MATASHHTSASARRPSGFADLAVVTAMMALLGSMYLTGRPGSLGRLMADSLDSSFSFFVSLQFIVLVPVIFLLEHRFPARPEQRGFSPSVIHDGLYMMIHLPAMAALTAFAASPISNFLDAHARWLVVDSTRSWPMPLMALLGWIIADFGAFVAHYAKHKVPLFWRFHMIHHSQARLNLFTANRTHPVDAIIDKLLLLVPFFIFFPSFVAEKQSVFLIALIFGWYVRFEHSNIRTNMGPLRYVLVSPQSHRVHHSTEPEHWNSNFATFFAWDRLFGLQHADVTSYPTTGINDPVFPEPQRRSA
ncbi:MAG: sterol desaturase family protein, partial [Acidimicrobiales bacterium]